MLSFACVKGLKITFSLSCAIPVPVSVTSKRSNVEVSSEEMGVMRRVIDPVWVNFSELPMRLVII